MESKAEMESRPPGVRWGPVGVFLLLAFALSWACFAGLRLAGVPFTVRALVGMFGPAAAALLTRRVGHEGLHGLGLRPRWGWAYLWAYLLPILLLGAGVALTLAVGEQRWELLGNLRLALEAGLRRLPPEAAAGLRRLSGPLLGVQVAQTLTIGVLVNCIAALGEELGWRGELLPRLAPLGGAVAAVSVGVVWGLWHAPVIALDGYEFGLRSWAVAPFFCLFTVPLGVILAWLRFRSGSVWPCVLMHATVNAVAGLAVLALSRPPSTLVGAPGGLLGVAPFWALAAWLVVTGRLRPPVLPASVGAAAIREGG
jgi:membrane protease YdiL (CAAX protease family)